MDIIESGRRISIGINNKLGLQELLCKDCQFLEDHTIMDYSVLVVEVPKIAGNATPGGSIQLHSLKLPDRIKTALRRIVLIFDKKSLFFADSMSPAASATPAPLDDKPASLCEDRFRCLRC